MHMCSKALGSTGGKSSLRILFPQLVSSRYEHSLGVILCNQTVRSALAQYSRCLTYSGAPSVPMVASIRAGYQLLASGQTQKVSGASLAPTSLLTMSHDRSKTTSKKW